VGALTAIVLTASDKFIDVVPKLIQVLIERVADLLPQADEQKVVALPTR
jgi:hypothetical protein